MDRHPFRMALWGPLSLTCMVYLLFALFLIDCQKPLPVRIGFSGPLTGKPSDLGLSGRNGVMLAMEEQNANGGINSRPIELLIKDDRSDPQVARIVDQELIDAGVTAIIGHMTSSMTMAVMELINRHKVVLLSPTTSTHELTGLDDYFIRVIEQSTAESDHLAAYAVKHWNCKTMAAIMDLSNPAYTRTYLESFQKAFTRNDRQMLPPVSFVTGKVSDYRQLARQVLQQPVDGILIICAALDGAMLCQQIRKLDARVPIVMAGWSFTPEFIENGGEAVKGTIFSHIFDPEGQQPRYLSFQARYVGRFSRQPDFAAVLSYEAAQLLFDALSTQGRTELKSALLRDRPIEGLQGNYMLDRFGDARRERFYITIKDHQYQTIRQ